MSGSERTHPRPLAMRLVRAVGAAALAAVLLAAAPALAQTARRVGLSLIVSHASQQPGPVDPSLHELHETLRNDFRYASMRVIERRRLDLRTGEIGAELTGRDTNLTLVRGG